MDNIRKIIKDNPEMTVHQFLELFTKKDLWDSVEELPWLDFIYVFYGLIYPMRLLNGDKPSDDFLGGTCTGSEDNKQYKWKSVFKKICKPKPHKPQEDYGADNLGPTRLGFVSPDKNQYNTCIEEYNTGLSNDSSIKEYAKKFKKIKIPTCKRCLAIV